MESLRVLMENRSKRPPATSGSTNDARRLLAQPRPPPPPPLPPRHRRLRGSPPAAAAAARHQQREVFSDAAQADEADVGDFERQKAKDGQSGGRHLSSSGNGSKNHVQREPMSLMERSAPTSARQSPSRCATAGDLRAAPTRATSGGRTGLREVGGGCGKR